MRNRSIVGVAEKRPETLGSPRPKNRHLPILTFSMLGDCDEREEDFSDVLDDAADKEEADGAALPICECRPLSSRTLSWGSGMGLGVALDGRKDDMTGRCRSALASVLLLRMPLPTLPPPPAPLESKVWCFRVVEC